MEKRRPTKEELQTACEDYVDRQLQTMQRHGGLREPLSTEKRDSIVQKVMSASVLN